MSSFAKPPLIDAKGPQFQKFAQQNIEHVIRDAPMETRLEGMSWYHNVHEATVKGAHESGIPTRHAAGVVAAVSPNMDWEKNNINAFSELHNLNKDQWGAIEGSLRQSQQAYARNAQNGFGKGHPLRYDTGRSQEARDALQGLSISTATDHGLLKAKRILEGADPDVVMPRRTSPKTNSFMDNIHDPGADRHVTIDGRAHDIAADRLQGWTQDRGIGSAALLRGRSRYEHFEDAYRGAAAHLSGEFGHKILPHEAQAIAWTHAKNLERMGQTKAGKDRTFGVRREGQSYSGLIAEHGGS